MGPPGPFGNQGGDLLFKPIFGTFQAGGYHPLVGFKELWDYDEEPSDQHLEPMLKNLGKVIGKDKIVSITKQGYKFTSKKWKQSLRRFLYLYIFLVLAIITLLSIFYYQSQEKLMFSNQRTVLSGYATEQVKRLKILHHYFPTKNRYPRDERFKSAIYDIEQNLIFSTLKNNSVNLYKSIYRTGDKIHFIKYLDDYYPRCYVSCNRDR